MIQALAEISAPTRALSRYIAQALTLPLPDAVAEKARHHVLDTLAAMVSGSRLGPGRIAIAYVRKLGGTAQASVIGSRIVTTCINAALANGMLAHADETGWRIGRVNAWLWVFSSPSVTVYAIRYSRGSDVPQGDTGTHGCR